MPVHRSASGFRGRGKAGTAAKLKRLLLVTVGLLYLILKVIQSQLDMYELVQRFAQRHSHYRSFVTKEETRGETGMEVSNG